MTPTTEQPKRDHRQSGGWMVLQMLASEPGSADTITCVVLSTHPEKGDAVIAALVAGDQLSKPAVGGWVIGVDVARKPSSGPRGAP